MLTFRCGDRGGDGIPVQQLLGQAPPAATGDSSGLRQQAWGPASNLLWNHHSKSVSGTLAAAAWRREWGQTGPVTCPRLFGHQMARLGVEPRLCSLWFSHSPCGPQTLSTSPQWCLLDPSLAPSPAPRSCQAPAGGKSIVSGDWGPPSLDADAPRLGARLSRQPPSSTAEAVGVGWEIQGPGGDGPTEADRSRLVLGGPAEPACRSLAPSPATQGPSLSRVPLPSP